MSATARRVAAVGGGPPRAAHAQIDLAALRHNFARVREAAPGARVLAAVKSNAYGHGLLTVAKALHEADGLAVACVEEALMLREAGVHASLMALQGVRNREELELAASLDVQLSVHAPHQLELLAGPPLGRPVGVWLKIDTGMHRLGVEPEEARGWYRRLLELPNVAGSPRLMTHLARADERDSDFTNRQMALFEASVSGLEAERSIANSAGILGWPATHGDWVRPGLMLYGGNPFVEGDAASLDLLPVMTLRAPLIAVKRVRQGEPVGYGGDFICPRDMTVGVAAIGYGDGYPRHAGTGTPALVNGRRSRLLGRVSMDMVALDLEGIEAGVGDEVILWGRGLPVEEVAAAAGTLAYELLCHVGGRVAVELSQ